MRHNIFGKWSFVIRLLGRKVSGRRSSFSTYNLIEFRFRGYARETLRSLREAIVQNFDIKMSEQRYVPHVTIVGPCITRDRKKLIKVVENVVKKYDLVSFKLGGFGTFPGRAIYADVSPSEELAEMRQNLVEKLGKFCKLPDYDYKPEFDVHATLCLDTELSEDASGNVELTFDNILEFLHSQKMPEMKLYVLRVTILGGNSKIVREYDLMLKRMLKRREALSGDVFKETLDTFRKKYDIDVSDTR